MPQYHNNAANKNTIEVQRGVAPCRAAAPRYSWGLDDDGISTSLFEPVASDIL